MFPKSLGFMIYPSTVWRRIINIINIRAWKGFTIRRINPPMTPPTIGPECGNEICNAYDNGNKPYILHTEYEHENSIYSSDYNSVYE